MRRRGLRARIRQQRRLAKRMATRHSMARRHQAGVRMLEMLGAWDDELSSTPRQFVPPAAPLAVTAAAAVATSDEPPAPVDADDDDVEAIAPAADRAGPARSVPAHGGTRAAPVADAPTRASPNVSPGAAARHAQPDAQGTSRTSRRASDSDHPETHPRRVARPTVPSVTPQPGPQPVSRVLASGKPAAHAERQSPGVRESAQTRDRVALPGQEHPAPTVEPASGDSRSPARGVDQAATPDTPVDGDIRVADAVAEIASAAPAPHQLASGEPTSDDASPSRTSAEYDVVSRALAALRASGELPNVPRPAPPRAGSAPEQPPVPGVAEPPPGDLARTPPNADAGQPPALAAHTRGADASAHSTAAPPAPEQQTSPSVPSEPANEPVPSVSAPRIDERRQARRPPGHAVGHRPELAPAEPPASSSHRAAGPVPERSERPAGETGSTQFQFTNIGRTPQEWRQLLIEATTPQPPTSRARPSRPVATPSQTRPADAPRITRPGLPSRTAPALSSPPSATVDASPAPHSAPPAREAHRRAGDPPTPPPPASRERSSSAVHPESDARAGMPHSVAPLVSAPTPRSISDTEFADAPRDRERIDPSSGDGPSAASPESAAPAADVRLEATLAADATEPASIEPATTARGVTAPSEIGGAPNVVGEESPPAAAQRAATAIPERTASAIPRSAPATTPPTPLAPSTRRFLWPLVGIDPDTVHVRRDDDAARLAAAHGADAATVGDDVVLPADRDERDPATLALIAHELTHVARARSRRFVPPVARGEWTASAAGIPRASSVRGVDAERARAAPAPDDEELMARVVEARVREAATRERAVAVTTFVEADHSPSADDDIGGNAHVDDAANGASATATPAPVRPARWGGLPAPWEPLPDFMTRARTSTTPSPAVSASPSPNDVAGAGASTASVRLAERGLGSAGEEPAHAEPPAPDGDGAPDIDVLARQVYAVLRRRLAAERRRGA